MDLSEIKKEIEALDVPSQREMIGFLLSLQMRRDPEWREQQRLRRLHEEAQAIEEMKMRDNPTYRAMQSTPCVAHRARGLAGVSPALNWCSVLQKNGWEAVHGRGERLRKHTLYKVRGQTP